MTSVARRGFSYSEEEVRALIEGYAELLEKVDTTRRGLRYLVTLADLSRALRHLPRKYWEVVLLVGLFGLSHAEASGHLRVSHHAVTKRYRRALEETTYWINGGE